MNLFDILNITSRIPYQLAEKLEGDAPKIQQLLALWTQAEPHVNALLALEKTAAPIWDSISPDVQAVLKAIQGGPT